MKSVLLIEDEPRQREVYAQGIRSAGYVVIEAGQVSEALRLLDQGKPDLIVLDIMMPPGQMNGIEFLARLHHRSPLVETPVLVVSGLGKEINRDVATRLGVRGIVSKPVWIDGLVQEVRRIIGPSGPLRGNPGRTNRVIPRPERRP